MSVEQLFADSSLHVGLGNEWKNIGYVASDVGGVLEVPYVAQTIEFVGLVRVLVAPSPANPMTGAVIQLGVGGVYQHPSYPTDGWDRWNPGGPAPNGIWEPSLHWVRSTGPNTAETYVPPGDTVKLTWSVGVTVEAGIYRHDATYVAPPGPPPAPPSAGTNCPPRPDWPYIQTFVIASSGDGKVMRFLR